MPIQPKSSQENESISDVGFRISEMYRQNLTLYPYFLWCFRKLSGSADLGKHLFYKKPLLIRSVTALFLPSLPLIVARTLVRE